MKNQQLLSVIVPVYQVEDRINRCLAAIVKQTYSNLEIILVDDGSTDRSPEICDLWKQRDIRIRVIHQENRGLAGARDTGLDAATGAYISFIDSDDWVEPDFLETMLQKLTATGSQLAECAVCQEFETGEIRILSLPDGVIRSKEASEHLLKNDGQVYSFVWNKLFLASVIGKVRFARELRYGEDTPFVWEAFQNCTVCCQVGKPLYHYVMRGDSLVSGGFSPRKMADLSAAGLILQRCRQAFPEQIKPAEIHLSLRGYYLLRQLLCTPHGAEEYPEEYQKILCAIKQISFRTACRYLGIRRGLIMQLAVHRTAQYGRILRRKAEKAES